MNHRKYALERLYRLAPRGAELGLSRMLAASARFDHPERAFEAVHIGGTNGKGSVSAMLAAMLHASDKRVGLYTSPHLCRFVERIRIDNEPIAEDILFPIVDDILEKAPELSFFEVTTLAAFIAFREMKVDLAVIEVGLGGRLDATNILPSPRAVAITRIAHDHRAQLGDSLSGIAREKAGILKANVPAILGPLVPEAREAILDEAGRLGAPTIFANEIEGFRDTKIGLAGAHQRDNAHIAIALAKALNLQDGAIAQGLRDVEWPGRLETIETETGANLLDAAHNPDGAQALAAALSKSDIPQERRALLFGAMADKNWAAMLDSLAPLANSRFYVGPSGREPISPAVLADAFGGVVVASVEEGLSRAREAVGEDGLVVIAGSIFLVGEARAILLDIESDPPVAL